MKKVLLYLRALKAMKSSSLFWWRFSEQSFQTSCPCYTLFQTNKNIRRIKPTNKLNIAQAMDGIPLYIRYVCLYSFAYSFVVRKKIWQINFPIVSHLIFWKLSPSVFYEKKNNNNKQLFKRRKMIVIIKKNISN